VHISLKQITDGLSNTLLLTEEAGRPHQYVMGGQLPADLTFSVGTAASPGTAGDTPTRGTWSGNACAAFSLYPTPTPGVVPSASGVAPDLLTCAINCYNGNGIYSFHTNGVNILLCDGSVRFITADINLRTLAQLCNRNDDEALSTGF